MRMFIVGVTCVVLSACSGKSSPTAPTSNSQTTQSADLALPGDPNHFDPDPLRGFESEKWHDLRYQSAKYVFGRKLVGLEVTAENLKRVAEGMGLIYMGKDHILIPGDNQLVDCIYDFEGPKARWQWQLSH